MVDPATLSMIVAGISAVSTLVSASSDLLDKVWADPQKRNEELLNLQKKSEENHKSTLEELKKNKKNFEEVIKTKEDAADERISKQKEENEKIIKEKEADSEKHNLKHEAEIKEMEKVHQRKLGELKLESKEVQKKKEEECRAELEKLKAEHAEEKAKCDKELAETKREGKEKVEEVEMEIKEIEKEKQAQFERFLEIERDAENEHLLVKKNMNHIIRQLKLENEKIRGEQIEKEDKRRMELISLDYKSLVNKIDQMNTIEIIRKFETIKVPFSSVRDSLESIKALCINVNGSAASMLTFSVSTDTENIPRQKSAFNFRVKGYHQHLLNTTTSDKNLLNTFFDLIKKMQDLISHEDLVDIHIQLPKMVKDQNVKEIKKYGEKAGKSCEKFKTVHKQLDDGQKKYTTKHTHVEKSQLAIGH